MASFTDFFRYHAPEQVGIHFKSFSSPNQATYGNVVDPPITSKTFWILPSEAEEEPLEVRFLTSTSQLITISQCSVVSRGKCWKFGSFHPPGCTTLSVPMLLWWFVKKDPRSHRGILSWMVDIITMVGGFSVGKPCETLQRIEIYLQLATYKWNVWILVRLFVSIQRCRPVWLVYFPSRRSLQHTFDARS